MQKTVTVPKAFDCPFCNHSKTIECQMRRDQKPPVGIIECTVCGANYTSVITHLTEPVDVYSDWIDACEQENEAVPED